MAKDRNNLNFYQEETDEIMVPSCMKHIEIVESTMVDPHVVRMHSLCSLIKESKQKAE